MRLKVSPKKARQMIDLLIEKGYDISTRTSKDSIVSTRIVDDWFGLVDKGLNKIFPDAAPIYRVFRCQKSSDVYVPDFIRKDDRSIKDDLEEALDVLLGYYDYFVSKEDCPVQYLKDTCQLWLNDSCCALDPNSNESELCAYMFNFGINEFVGIPEIYKVITGDKYIPKTKDSNLVKNAVEGVNKKTNKVFGFNLFTKRKNVVAIYIPSQLLFGRM